MSHTFQERISKWANLSPPSTRLLLDEGSCQANWRWIFIYIQSITYILIQVQRIRTGFCIDVYTDIRATSWWQLPSQCLERHLTHVCQGGQVETLATVGRGNCCSAAADSLLVETGSDDLQEMQNSEISWFLNTDNYLKTKHYLGQRKQASLLMLTLVCLFSIERYLFFPEVASPRVF